MLDLDGSHATDPRLALLLDVPEAITVQDAAGRLLFANDAAARLCGFPSPDAMLSATVEDWIGRFEIYDAAGQPLPVTELPGRRALGGEEPPERLIRFRDDAGERWAWVAARRVRASDPPLVINAFRDVTSRIDAERQTAEELRLSRALQSVALALASELDHDRLVQRITDEATAICGAAFGAFFHTVERDDGGSFLLYTLSGAPREAFARFGQPRATPVFAPTFRGDGPVRSADIRQDPRYGQMGPHHGMPPGHLPVVSYLAIPVVAASGEVLGGLFFGHPEPDRFTEAHEHAVAAIANHAAVALDKARAFRRLRAEEARNAENLRRLRLALEAGRLGTWEYDLAAGRVHWSPEIEAIHGIPPGSFDGSFEAYQRDIHPDDRAWVLEAIGRHVAEGREHRLVYRIVRPDGAIRWLEAFGTFVRDDAGAAVRLIGVCSDVTERIEAQEARAALRIQKMLEGIGDAFAVYDRNWITVFANQASTAAIGLAPADVIGKPIWSLVPDAVGTRFHTELLRVVETGEAATFEEHYAPLDRWFEVHAYPVAGIGIAVYSRDVTARRREQALTSRLAVYGELRAEIGSALSAQRDVGAMLQDCCQALVDKLGASFARVWLVDATGATLELHASAGKYTHIDGGHARVPVGAFKIGKIASERQPHLTNDVQHDPRVGDREWARREGMVAFAGYPLIVNDRLVGVMALFATAPLPDDTLVALGSIGDAIAQGVERRRAELALAEHARELARSNADLEQFAYVASHDLQEPLRMVSSYVQLLERRYRDRLDDDARDFIGFAVEGVTRMRSLIDDLLAYSRIGTRGREPAPVALGRILDLAEKNLERAIVESGAAITRDDLPEVYADENQLLQVLQNLIGNAIKFRRDDPPRIHVGARRDGADWVISVRDNGIGIEPQYFDRIFVIFQRLNPREHYPGTGIGLAIAKKVIERHGGRIWVDSQPGEGSTISFSLPITPRSRRPS